MDSQLEKATNIVFVGGTGRCGTNITKELLAEHPQVAALPFESRFTIDPHGIIDCYNTLKHCWSPYISNSKIRELKALLLSMRQRNIPVESTKEQKENGLTPYAEWELQEWFPHYLRHVNRLIEQLGQLSYPGTWPGQSRYPSDNQMMFTPYKETVDKKFRLFFRALFNDYLQQNNQTVFVDDNTWNMLFAVELKTILPEAKFIHLVRDPKDVIVSFTHQRWAPDTLDMATTFYTSLMKKIMDKIDHLSADSIFQIKLEDLISDPAAILADIHHFIGLKSPDKPVGKALDRSHQGRWEKELPPVEQKKLRSATAEFCAYYGY